MTRHSSFLGGVSRSVLKPGPFVGWGLLTLTMVLSGVAFFGAHFWLFDLASHFRLQYLMVQAVALVYLLVTRKWLGITVVCLFMALNLIQVGPYLRLNPEPASAVSRQHADTLKLLHMNLWVLNPTLDKAIEVIRRTPADVISLQEYSPAWKQRIEASGVLNGYPYRFGYGEDMLYSRLPFEAQEVRFQEPYTLKYFLRGTVRLPHGQRVALYALHAFTPVSDSAVRKQWAQLAALGDYINRESQPVVVVGDLNTTPWGYGFRQLIEHTRLKDTQIFTGLQPSWSQYFGLPWISIDHCLITPALFLTKRTVGPFTGSDHLPLHVELAVPYRE